MRFLFTLAVTSVFVSLAACWPSSLFDLRPALKLSSINKKMCHSCYVGAQCRSGVCFERKCVSSLSRGGKRTCNQDECAPCDTRFTCRTNRCWGTPGNTKCVKHNDESKKKCFPELYSGSSPSPGPQAEECESCAEDGDCKSQICTRGKCTRGSIKSIKKCLGKPHCSKCKSRLDCATSICYRGRCTGNGLRSKYRCFGRPNCFKCKENSQCASGRCINRRCKGGRYSRCS